MEKIGEKSVKKHPGSENLTPGGPGRPKGQRNYLTIYREALKKIADTQNMTAEELETLMEEAGIRKAIKGDFHFWKDIRDRVHGKAPQPLSNAEGEDGIQPLMVKIIGKDEQQ